MRNFCVIGSGISGATIANLLNKKHTVDLYDKARGLGGRSSFKRLDKIRGFDHGTQYFSPKSPEFKRFTKKYKTLESLSKANETQILKMWEGLGYYRRARNLLASAKLLVKEHNSKLPNILKEINRLASQQ